MHFGHLDERQTTIFDRNLVRWTLLKGVGKAYLPGTEVNYDQQGSSSRVRLFHCTSGIADLCDFPKCGKLECVISVSGDLRSR